MPTPQVVLLGDSILDNRPYTAGEPDTTTHLQRLLDRRWTVELLAEDGARMADVAAQCERLRRPAAALLSVGGNDLTQHVDLLARPADDSSEVYDELIALADAFGAEYEAVVDRVRVMVPRLVLCTIYDVRLQPPALARLARAPIAVCNDRIIAAGARRGLDVLDLRAVCTEDADFTLQIEPSARGAEQIARAIARVLEDDGATPRGRVFAG